MNRRYLIVHLALGGRGIPADDEVAVEVEDYGGDGGAVAREGLDDRARPYVQ